MLHFTTLTRIFSTIVLVIVFATIVYERENRIVNGVSSIWSSVPERTGDC